MDANQSMTNVKKYQLLKKISTDKKQYWAQLADKYGVSNPTPPWKSSLDGMCDALDKRNCELPLTVRRNEEDELCANEYADVPYPEKQLLALAHSFVKRGIISETELETKLDEVKKRLNTY
ncbi:hypothetical protein ACJU26_04210 [Acidithiobacillus sp. M4-SHS-6]|uniref:hypothetical protein n=1 Tax=Acidithiobacillus sp. M4-SHS-6 TaxID=3383024 RepID=UPI0039BE3981